MTDCKEFSENDGYKGILSCTKCSKATHPKNFDLSIKTCAKFPEVSNCLEYSIGNTFLETSFFCTKCKERYFTSELEFPS